MKTVTARTANQGFSRLLAEVRAGKEVVITSRGEPIAKMVPYRPKKLTPARQAAIKRMMAIIRRGYHLGGQRISREEMHER